MTARAGCSLWLAAALGAGCLPPAGPPEPVPGPGSCAPDAARFGLVVDAPLLQSTCIACHVEGGPAQGTRLVLRGGTTEDVAAHNMSVVFALAGETADGRPLLVAKPTNRHPDGHGGGEVVAPGSLDETRLRFAADWGAGTQSDCTPPPGLVPVDCADTPARGPRELRRLTRNEYLATVFDLTGVTMDFVDLPLDQSESVFDTHAASLVVNDQLAEKLARAAEGIASRVVDDNPARISPCGTTATAACRDQFLREFGARVFRRPLTGDELDRYRDFFDLVAAQEGRTVAIREAATALLQSPHFLYRAELGGRTGGDTFALTPWEVATEMSYLVLGTTPDDDLLRAAATGALDTPEGRQASLDRLLGDPRAEATLAAGFAQWWAVRGLETQAPPGAADGAVYAAMERAFAEEMVAAAVAGTTMAELLTRDEVFVDGALAAHYGLSGAPAGTALVDGEGRYGGLLRHGAVLVAHSHTAVLAPIRRGKLVRERLLCQPLPMPPANAAAMQEELTPGGGDDPRAGSNARLEAESCKGCHEQMDPIGHGFAAYDLVGRFDAGADASGGEVLRAGDATGTFDSVKTLADQLAASREVGQCMQEVWLSYGAGGLDPALACGVDDELTPDALTPWALLLGVVDLPHFTARIGPTGAEDGPATEALPLMLDGDLVGPGTEPEPTPEPEPAPEPAPEPGPDEVVPEIPDVFPDGVTVTAYRNLPQDDWGTGYCMRFRFELDVPLGDWSMPLEVIGTITTSWNVARDGDSGTVTFSGEGFTANLGPGVYDDVLGYCADYSL